LFDVAADFKAAASPTVHFPLGLVALPTPFQRLSPALNLLCANIAIALVTGYGDYVRSDKDPSQSSAVLMSRVEGRVVSFDRITKRSLAVVEMR
jgi:hypothetical protein